MTILQKTHLYLEDYYSKSNLCLFCGENKWTDLAHIAPNDIATALLTQKAYNLTKSSSSEMIDMLLFNTIPSCPWCNGRYHGKGKTCKTEDIVHIPFPVIHTASLLFNELIHLKDLMCVSIFKKYHEEILRLNTFFLSQYTGGDYDLEVFSCLLEIQKEYQKSIRP